MDQEISKRFDALELKVGEVYRSVERMRKYFLWTLIITVAVIILPLVGLAFAIPAVLNMYNATATLGGL